ncbi:MAG: YraN family protein [Bacteroidia bacterium]|jgi:putative endonuclease|nr:YraN family protein [Bacteroidia bacterium]
MKTHQQILGQEGEDIAVKYLIDKGYVILKRNYRSGHAEIDIIAQIDKQLVIVEVKTRNTSKYGDPEQSVSSKKQLLLTQATEAYLFNHDLDLTVRYDIISIIKNQYKIEVTHLEDAFWPGLY